MGRRSGRAATSAGKFKRRARGRSREARARAAPDSFGGGWAAPQAVTSVTVRSASKASATRKTWSGWVGALSKLFNFAESCAMPEQIGARRETKETRKPRYQPRSTGRNDQRAKQPSEAATAPTKRRKQPKHDKARHPKKRDGELCRSYARFTPIPASIPSRSKLRPARS